MWMVYWLSDGVGALSGRRSMGKPAREDGGSWEML